MESALSGISYAYNQYSHLITSDTHTGSLYRKWTGFFLFFPPSRARARSRCSAATGGKHWEELRQYLHLRWTVGSVLGAAEHDGCSVGAGHKRTVNSALSRYQLISAQRYLLELK